VPNALNKAAVKAGPAGFKPNPPNSERLRDRLQHTGRKPLERLAQSSDRAANRRTRWGMSEQIGQVV
jgi:hypothetical protein